MSKKTLKIIGCSVPDSVFQMLVVALVMLRLDYGNATLAGLPAFQHCRVDSSQFSMLQPGSYIGHSLRAHYTSTPRPPLAAVSRTHRFQVSHACLSMSTRSRSSVPI